MWYIWENAPDDAAKIGRRWKKTLKPLSFFLKMTSHFAGHANSNLNGIHWIWNGAMFYWNALETLLFSLVTQMGQETGKLYTWQRDQERGNAFYKTTWAARPKVAVAVIQLEQNFETYSMEKTPKTNLKIHYTFQLFIFWSCTKTQFVNLSRQLYSQKYRCPQFRNKYKISILRN